MSQESSESVLQKRMTVSELEGLLLTHVIDVRFARENLLPGRSSTRRMLCTKSYDLLNSTNGRIVLNYRPPKGNKKYSEPKTGTLVVWDILMQDYRKFSATTAVVINKYPADDEFWKYFKENIYPLTAEQKIAFMDS